MQILDLADEIAYAVHDLEDALSLGYFTIDEFLFELSTSYPEESKLLEKDFIVPAKSKTKDVENYKTIQDYSQVFRKTLTSSLIHKFILDITFRKIEGEEAEKYGVKDGNMELRLDKYARLSEFIRETIFSCITRYPDIAIYERRGEIILKSLYNIYIKASKENKSLLLPPDYRSPGQTSSKNEDLSRNCVDYIAGMMDTFAIAEYERLLGTKYSDISITEIPDIYIPPKN